MYSYGIIANDELTKVPQVKHVSEVVLDERHLSKSALRALEVLEFFAANRNPARAIEVAHALSMSPSSADQLLKSMVSRAYLIFDPQRKVYHPSPRLLGFAGMLQETYFGESRLLLLMQDLVERTGYFVSLSTPFGRLMQLIDFVGPSEHLFGRAPGHLFPMLGSVAGAAVLATLPIDTVCELIAQSEDQLGGRATSPDSLLDRLSEVRTNGHAFGGLSEAAEKCSIAVALPRAQFRIQLALSLRGPFEEMKARRWHLAAVIDETIAAHLG